MYIVYISFYIYIASDKTTPALREAMLLVSNHDVVVSLNPAEFADIC